MTTEMKKTLKIWVLTAIGSMLLMTVIFGIAMAWIVADDVKSNVGEDETSRTFGIIWMNYGPEAAMHYSEMNEKWSDRGGVGTVDIRDGSNKRGGAMHLYSADGTARNFGVW